jgi:glutathione S-transferase
MKLVIGNKNYSSWSLRPWLMLKQADLPFEEIRVRLRQPDTAAQIARYSPSGKVPVLMQDELILWESIAICEYIAELAPGLLPADQTARAMARVVSAEMHAGFLPLRTHLPMDCRQRYPARTDWLPEVMQDIKRITAIWRDCRQQFGQGDFLFGAFSMADAMFAPVVTRFVTYAVPLDAICQAYVETVLALPAMQLWLNDAAAESEMLMVN